MKREQSKGPGEVTGASPPEMSRTGLYLPWAFSLASHWPDFVSKMQRLGAESGQPGRWVAYL